MAILTLGPQQSPPSKLHSTMLFLSSQTPSPIHDAWTDEHVVKEIFVATPSLQQSAPEGKSFGQLSTPQKRLPKQWLSESQSPSSTSHGF